MLDPLTILAMANGAVAAVKKGVALYKDIKGAAGQVKEVLDDLEKTFTSRHAGKKPSQEAIKQYNAERERVRELGKSDPNDVISDIGNRMGDFFDAFDKIERHFYEEERAAQEVYEGDQSVNRRALQRVLVRSRLEMMWHDIRQEMTWNSPAELKDLWTRFSKMREQIDEEQRQAWEKLRVQRQHDRFERSQFIDFCWEIVAWLIGVLLIVGYAAALLWAIVLHKDGSLHWWWDS